MNLAPFISRYLLNVFALVVTLQGVALAENKTAFSLNGIPVPQVVATVNGTELSSELLKREMIAYQLLANRQGKIMEAKDEKKVAQSLLMKAIDDELIFQQGIKQNINIDPATIDRELNHIKFHGPITRMNFRKNRYLLGKKLSLPSIHGTEFILYGLTLADINGNGKNEIVILDKDARLRVYGTNGRILVQSNEYYGRDPRVIEVGVREDIAGIVQQGEPVQYRGRLSFIRQGAKRYLILPRIDSAAGSLLPGIVIDPQSSISFLNLTREGFQKSAEMRKQRGYLAGYGVMKTRGNNPKTLHMATVDEKGGFGGKTVSTIYSYFFQK